MEAIDKKYVLDVEIVLKGSAKVWLFIPEQFDFKLTFLPRRSTSFLINYVWIKFEKCSFSNFMRNLKSGTMVVHVSYEGCFGN